MKVVHYRQISPSETRMEFVQRYGFVDAPSATESQKIRANNIAYLSSLPPYYALCRIRNGNEFVEATIKPDPVADVPEAVAQARLAAIYAHSRSPLCQTPVRG